ncbi:hypothetical protein SMF913_10248 [Streptomyces malaysiensis]|uniref:Uncharacterized protein n=1 Tax=Streptomyces malaysiensis TaxID=92644 RepID=A0A2J7Z1R6_STRMQ|nr:hypothetical protein SMF913_10248 [Streptomyces malaysiensis]
MRTLVACGYVVYVAQVAHPYGHARHRGEDERGFLTALDLEGIRRLGYAVDDKPQ